jgi:branched-chain amino acid aminotransferase
MTQSPSLVPLRLAWLNGETIPIEEARVGIADHGFVVGDGVFEAVLVTKGRTFALGRHLERLAHSAKELGIGIPDLSVIPEAASQLIQANGVSEAALRITVTPGPGLIGSPRPSTPAPESHTLAMILASHAPTPPSAKVVLCPWTRNEKGALAGLKTTSYAENVRALAWAKEHGGDEALFANTMGMVCEGTGTNLFVVIDGEVLTPPLSAGCLPGVTRALLLENMEVTERDIPVSWLQAPGAIQEAFLTSSLRNVQALEAIGNVSLPEVPGPLTRKASEVMQRLVEENPEP